MPLTNAPGEGLPPGCMCVLMAPGTTYEALAVNPECPVHNPGPTTSRGRGTRYRPGTRKRNGYRAPSGGTADAGGEGARLIGMLNGNCYPS